MAKADKFEESNGEPPDSVAQSGAKRSSDLGSFNVKASSFPEAGTTSGRTIRKRPNGTQPGLRQEVETTTLDPRLKPALAEAIIRDLERNPESTLCEQRSMPDDPKTTRRTR